jgi:CubicO group peptidase (beta-lactamase class C family)
MMFLQSSILFAVGAIIHTTWSLCPVDGPLLPRPRGLSYSSYLQEATQKLSNSIQSALNGSIESGWAISNTSFSLGLVSLDSTEPLWQYHHRGSANTNGSNIVDGDSQYLIGSISKLFSDLVFLRTGIDHNTPVTDYLPQLRHQNSKINWEDITIGSFADHLSGIPPNCESWTHKMLV